MSEEARCAVWFQASLGPHPGNADFTPQHHQALITTMSHYNLVGFPLWCGLIKAEEVLATWP